MTTIITLSRYPDLFQRLAESMKQFEPARRRIVVTSGEEKLPTFGWEHLVGVEPFIFSRNSNQGIRACPGENVLLINDDCKLVMPLIDECERVAENDPTVGIISPSIDGGVGGLIQKVGSVNHLCTSRHRLAFSCVFIPARTIAKVGLLDEDFTGYGGEDDDYCHRAQRAGFRLVVDPSIVVKHGLGPTSMSVSFLRGMTLEERNASMQQMLDLVRKKGQIPTSADQPPPSG